MFFSASLWQLPTLQPSRPARALGAAGLLLLLFGSLTAPVPAPGATVTAQIKDCLRQREQSARCLDLIFRDVLAAQPAAEVLAALRRYQTDDPELRLLCHPVVHAVGRELYRLAGTIHDAFKACDQTCHSGCYHGVVERFLWGDTSAAAVPLHVSRALLTEKAAAACPGDVPMRLRFQCLHGLGHAILYFTGYELGDALDVCAQLPDEWSQRSCYGGVFMENVTGASPEKRFVSATDYHHPCNQVAQPYRADCYLMQSSRMIEMGLPPEAIFAECAKAKSFRAECTQSIGRDLSNEARVHGPRSPARKCELATGADRQACIRGLVYALADNTWDGSYALPLCAALSDHGDGSACFRVAARYLQAVFDGSAAEVVKECQRHLAEPSPCLAAVAE